MNCRSLRAYALLLMTVGLGGCEANAVPDGTDAASPPTGDAAFLDAFVDPTRDAGPVDVGSAGVVDGGSAGLVDVGSVDAHVANACSPNPCLAGGVCALEGEDGFVCACADGFEGDTCETNINECAPNPCLNGGTCTDGVNDFTCACPVGYEGDTCETNIDDCAPGLCLNGGTCVDGLNAYTCSCAAGFGGDDCAQTCGGTATATASGDWTSPSTWGGTVPTSGMSIVVPNGNTVTVPAGASVRVYACATVTILGALVNRGDLTVDAPVTLRGPNPATAATLTNEGSLRLSGLSGSAGASGASMVSNAASGVVTNRGSFTFNRLYNSGAWTVASGSTSCSTRTVCSFANSGTLMIASGAGFSADVPPAEAAQNTGILVNHGNFASLRRFENSGTFTNTGTFATTFDLETTCGFTNTATATLTNAGTLNVSCHMVNGGTLTNTGTLNIARVSWASLRSSGTLTNEAGGSLFNSSTLENTGTLVNHGRINSLLNFSNSGTFTNTGSLAFNTALSDCVFRNTAAATLTNSGTLTVNCQMLNQGTVTNSGSLEVVTPHWSALRNSGTLTNETSGSLSSETTLENSGTLVNRGRMETSGGNEKRSGDGFVSTGTFTSSGTHDVNHTFLMRAGSTTLVEAGGTIDIRGNAVANSGTFDLFGALITRPPEGRFGNLGTFNQRCGSSVVIESGSRGWSGNAAVVETPCL